MGIRLTFGTTSRIFAAGPITVGRDAENQFRLSAASPIAPRHAVFREVQGKWLVESVCERPLTVGNGRPAQLAWLSSGDTVHLADSGADLLFEVTAAGQGDRLVDVSSEPLPESRKSVPASAESPQKAARAETKAGRRRILLPVAGALALAGAVLSTMLFPWRSSRLAQDGAGVAVIPSPPSSNPAADRGPLPVLASTVGLPAASPDTLSPVDPAEFLVPIGIADFSTDNRPHILGVGWLLNERTVVASRILGETIATLVRETKERGQPRSGCAIHGVPLPVESVQTPPGLAEVALLTLAEPASLPSPPGRQWRRVSGADVQRLRERRESLQYVSYARFPRPKSVAGDHGFSLMAYDADAVSVVSAEPKFEYESRRHVMRPNDEAPAERGGLIVDGRRQILGMVLLNAEVLWTSDLERGLPELPKLP